MKKFQSVFFQGRDQIDAVALQTRMHSAGKSAGKSIVDGTPLTYGAGLRRENVGIDALLPHQIPYMIGQSFVGNPGI